MASSTIKGTLGADIEKVWEIVTSLDNCAWRSDISRIEILNDRQFTEYAKDGYPTDFTVTASKPPRQWEFDMENSNMKGHWSGIFTAKDGQTELEFTEDVNAKKAIMKPFIKGYLKKQQRQYLADLQKALSDSK